VKRAAPFFVFFLLIALLQCGFDEPPDPNPPYIPPDTTVNVEELEALLANETENELDLDDYVVMRGSWESFESAEGEFLYPQADPLGKLYHAIAPLGNAGKTIMLDFSKVNGQNIKRSDVSIVYNNWRKPGGKPPALKAIILPKDMGRIGEYSFYQCDKLSTVTFLSDKPPVIPSSAFERSNNQELTFIIPAGTQDNYQALITAMERTGWVIIIEESKIEENI